MRFVDQCNLVATMIQYGAPLAVAYNLQHEIFFVLLLSATHQISETSQLLGDHHHVLLLILRYHRNLSYYNKHVVRYTPLELLDVLFGYWQGKDPSKSTV